MTELGRRAGVRVRSEGREGAELKESVPHHYGRVWESESEPKLESHFRRAAA